MTTRRTWLIVNKASGSHDDALIGQIRNRLAAMEMTPERVLDCSNDDLPNAAAAAAAGLTHLVIHGGDGTLNGAITRLEAADGAPGWDGAILALPGGTANLLCHRLYPQCDPLAILHSLDAGELAPMRLDCVRGRNVTALAELVAGPGARWADVREEMREHNLGEVLSKSIDAAERSAAGPWVQVTEPSMGREDGYPGVRLVPGGGGLKVEGYGAEGIGEYLQQGLAILKRDFRDGPHDDLGPVASVTLRSIGGKPLPLMTDGERSTGAPEESFSLARLRVDLLGPRNG
ncbi:diacylglycerol kinase family protein [Pseudopontixanthobacter vadosimaris]|uniref:diacylglycerol kinase family protein n=1 Tax=Pseudopontixanthobacter vadosimaris TaxID=2726450 RepID=UPI001473543F|nr:diacylglycerol kinase family protein [Pseudopontixanthobacter vadosimaris]